MNKYVKRISIVLIILFIIISCYIAGVTAGFEWGKQICHCPI